MITPLLADIPDPACRHPRHRIRGHQDPSPRRPPAHEHESADQHAPTAAHTCLKECAPPTLAGCAATKRRIASHSQYHSPCPHLESLGDKPTTTCTRQPSATSSLASSRSQTPACTPSRAPRARASAIMGPSTKPKRPSPRLSSPSSTTNRTSRRHVPGAAGPDAALPPTPAQPDSGPSQMACPAAKRAHLHSGCIRRARLSAQRVHPESALICTAGASGQRVHPDFRCVRISGASG